MDLGFDDSYFDSTSGTKREGKKEEKGAYEARQCELQWFMKYCQNTSQLEPDSIHDLGFMVLKYKADLIYYQRNYLEASELYKKVLAVVPRSNGCVTREIREALVRCYLRLEQGELAQLEAEHLILPPHEKDWSSWKLLAQCHKLLHNYEAQVTTLQTSASLQRCHPDFWVCLSEGYKDLQLASSETRSVNLCCSDCDGSHASVCDNLRTILLRTIQLFRPYLSWRTQSSKQSESTEPECLCDDKNHKDLEGDNIACYTDMDSANCTEHCIFFGTSDLSRYFRTIMFASESLQEITSDLPIIPNLRFHLCFDHSPFSLLIRHLISPENFTKVAEDLCKCSLSEVARQLVNSIHAMAECSCLVWARQLLLYSVKYSHSFPKEALQSELSDVQARLENCHEGTRNYILKHFSKRTVFDEK